MKWRMLNITLWRYSDEIAEDRLLKHFRIARQIIRLFCFASLGFFSSLAIGLSLDMSTVDVVILLVFLVPACVLTLPALFSHVWLGEIEEALKRRGRQWQEMVAAKRGLRRYYGQGILWAVLVVLLPVILRWLGELVTCLRQGP